MAAAVPYLLAASVGLSAVGSISQGNQQGAAGDYNAAVAHRNAQLAVQQGNVEADQQKRKAVLTLGNARSLYGASGVTAEGSPLDVLESSATQAEMDNQLIKYRSRLRAYGYDSESALDKASAKNARFGGYFGAASSILTGALTYGTYGLLGASDSAAGSIPGSELGGYGSSVV